MACITRQHIGKYTYLYESVSFRDEQGKPRNKKIKIGKVDPKTGHEIYYEDFLGRMAQAGIPFAVQEVERMPTDRTPQELTLEILSSVRS